jgi:hypothetical protein
VSILVLPRFRRTGDAAWESPTPGSPRSRASTTKVLILVRNEYQAPSPDLSVSCRCDRIR